MGISGIQFNVLSRTHKKVLLNFTFTAYTWNVEYSDDSRLLKNDSKTKEYYFNYYQTGTTYINARKICQNKGRGWDVANFQALLPKGEKGEFLNYKTSVKNIEEALSPL